MTTKTTSPFFKVVLGSVVVALALVTLIPNLLRSRMTGCPGSLSAAGAWNVRTINTAQITYYMAYEKAGYAPNLSALGGWPHGPCAQESACLLDGNLGCPEGIGQAWCTKDGYRYNVQSSSTGPPYKDYWVTATPVRSDPDLRTYCSAADAVVRSVPIPPLTEPLTLEECLSLPEIH